MDLLIGYKRQSLSRLSLSSCTRPLSDAVILGNPGRRSSAAQSCPQELRDSLLYRIRPTLLSKWDLSSQPRYAHRPKSFAELMF
jgi:hypothetical protein